MLAKPGGILTVNEQEVLRESKSSTSNPEKETELERTGCWSTRNA